MGRRGITNGDDLIGEQERKMKMSGLTTKQKMKAKVMGRAKAKTGKKRNGGKLMGDGNKTDSSQQILLTSFFPISGIKKIGDERGREKSHGRTQEHL